jgi:hypothetical protein
MSASLTSLWSSISALATGSGAYPRWLDTVFFERWPGALLQRDWFEAFTVALSIGLSLVGAGLLLIEQRARRLGEPYPEKKARRIGILLTVVAFLLYFDFFNPNTRYAAYYHRHELYHYYLGSKYFTEVGYDRLYACTAIAEVELGRGAQIRKREIRDLGSKNLIMPTTETYIFDDPGQCKNHFTSERWDAFKQDVTWFEQSSRGEYWENMQKDHGYNPPPVWTMTGKAIASLAPAGDGFFKLLALIDITLQLGTVLLINWAFGWRAMTLAAIFWGCNAPANFYWTGGAFLRQDWIFFAIAALCLLRKRYFVLAGVALTWSTLLRIFPVALFGGIGIIALFHLLRHRRPHPDHLRFFGGAALAIAVLVPASMAVTGKDSYRAFADHIALHKDTPLTNHMGLETMLVHDWQGRMVFSRDDRLDDPFEGWKAGRTERKHALRPVFLAINVLLLGWLAWALHRTKLLWIGMALSVPIIISLTNLTCYYFSVFLAVAALVRPRQALGPAYLALAGASQVLLGRFYWIDDKYTAESYLFVAFGVAMLYAYSRPFKLADLIASVRPRAKPAMLRS